MPVMIDKPFHNAAPAPPSRLFSREQFHWLHENQFLTEDRRYELIEGSIIAKMSQKEPHIGLLLLWFYALGDAFGREFLRSQAPIALSDVSEPELDIAVTTRNLWHYLRSGTIPTADEIRLVVEISASTLAGDLMAKAALYAQNNIPEYVVADVIGRRLIVHRDPESGGYSTVFTLVAGDTFLPLAAPTASFAVAEFLP